jgi:hypothetical protein
MQIGTSKLNERCLHDEKGNPGGHDEAMREQQIRQGRFAEQAFQIKRRRKAGKDDYQNKQQANDEQRPVGPRGASQ